MSELPKEYLKHVLVNGHPNRWNKPVVKVYLYENTIGVYKKEEIITKTKTAFSDWENALCGKIRFEYVKDVKDADIRVEYQRNNCDGTIGLCQYTKVAPNGEYLEIDIALGLIYSHMFYQDALHEIGHAIGLRGHSPFPLDNMYANLRPHYNNKLTEKDINTARLIYDMPLDGQNFDNLPKLEKDIMPEIKDYSPEQLGLTNQEYKDLLTECLDIGNMNLYKMQLANIQLREDTKKGIEHLRNQT